MQAKNESQTYIVWGAFLEYDSRMIPGVSRRLARGLFFGLAGLSAIGAVVAASVYSEGSRKPDFYEVRRHVLSKLTAAQITAIRKDVEARHRGLVRREESEDESRRQGRMEQRRACMDYGFREKNPSICDVGLGEYLPFQPSISLEQMYEMEVLGGCLLIATVREARKYGCLPSE